MSTHFAIVHDFETDAERFWRVFFDELYAVALYERIKVRERALLEKVEDDATIKFAVRVLPQRDLPGPVKKIIGGELGYTERSTYYKGKDYIDVVIEPTLIKNRTKIRGVYSLKALGAGQVRRTFEGDISVDIPIVGRKVEEYIIQDVRRAYDIAAEVTTEWLNKVAS